MKPISATLTSSTTGRRLFSWSCALLTCGICGAFLFPSAPTSSLQCSRYSISPALTRELRIRQPSSKVGVHTQQQDGSVDEDLQLAVHNLAAQVEDLTAIVRQLTEQTTGVASTESTEQKNINGAVVGNDPAVPVVALSGGKANKAGPTELVSTAGAQERIDTWLKEQGLEAATPSAVASPPQAVVAASPDAAAATAGSREVASATVLPAAAPPAEEASEATPVGSDYKIKIEWDGATHEVSCDAETTILEAAMDAGLELPSSCMSGSCLTCPGKIISGSVDQSEGVLEEEQTNAGYMLTCVSYPMSNVHFAVIGEDELP